MKALALKPADRYPTVKDFQRDIEAYQNGFATSAEHAGLWKQVRLFVKRNKVATAAAAAVAVAVVGGSIVSTAQWARAQRGWAKADERFLALKGVAPDLIAAARGYVETDKTDEALRRVDYAVELVPDNAEYHVMRTAARNRTLCAELRRKQDPSGHLPASDVFRLFAQLRDQKRFAEARLVLRQVSSGSKTLESAIAGALQSAKIEFRNLTVDADGACRAEVLNATDITGIAGLPFAELTFIHCEGLSDLSPLRGMPLRALSMNCSGHSVTDLGPLTGMPLETLGLGSRTLTDLSPLKGMPLRSLVVSSSSGLSDLSPLKDLPLEELDISSSGVSDISVLTNLTKLTSLKLHVCTRIRDVSPLRRLPLRKLVLSDGDGGGPDIQGMEALRGMSLEELRIAGRQASDLTPLKGMPIKRLQIYGCPVRDLSPLAGMPLRWLFMRGVPVSDLSPLKGMPLECLNMLEMERSVRDLVPLKGMTTLQRIENFSPAFWLYREAVSVCSTGTLAQVEAIVRKVQTDYKDVPAMKTSLAVGDGLLAHHLPGMRALDSAPTMRPATTVQSQGHHYLVCLRRLTWPEAQAVCERTGGHLVTFSDSGEQQRMLIMWGTPFWTGGQINSDRQFGWVTGEPWVFREANPVYTGGGVPSGSRLQQSVGGMRRLVPTEPSERLTFIIEWDQ
jgi:hypothetical protein